MKKIAIVNQRYGMEVNGGSELYTRLIAEKLSAIYDVEVLTTCALDYTTWANHYEQGVEDVNGVQVRRFPVKCQRKQKEFDEITAMVFDDSKRTEELEYQWIKKQGPYCPEFLEYIEEHEKEYDVFIFVTYLYYLTAMAMPVIAGKSILIPTAHDEPFLKFKAYQTVFEAPKGYVFLTEEERKLVHSKFDTKDIFYQEAAVGIDVPDKVDGEAFCKKFQITDPYMVYVGRIDEGKNCHILFEYFQKWKKENPDNPLKLVLMGKSVINIPKSDDIISLGFVSDEDKYNGIAASKLLVLPSQYESLSISVLEAMSLKVPVLVNGVCEVLKGHCIKSNAGLYYNNYPEFAQTVNYMTQNESAMVQMGINGKKYVDANYQWNVILERLSKVIDYVAEESKKEVKAVEKKGKKIGFVIPWFGMNIQGGAESELRELVLHLKDTELDIEVLTTCVKAANTDWNLNYHREGLTYEKGVPVRRFPVRKRNTKIFDAVNWKLMQGEKISRLEQEIFIKEMINSPAMYDYMKKHDEEYSVFVYIPYLFGTTYYGAKQNPKKAVLLPCFHDEGYFHMDIFKEMYSQVAGIIYNAEPEKELVEKHYDVSNVKQIVMGIGMDTDIEGDARRFREKYKIDSPFILYAGRKDPGKNTDTLVQYFSEYKRQNQNDLKLVLIGGGEIRIPSSCEKDVIDLGFVSVQDKYDAYAAAELLCQPSFHESFSLVIMESWLCGRPVLVSEKCEVTKNFVKQSNGGLYFDDYYEFEKCVNFVEEHPDKAKIMAEQGKKYVNEMFCWDVIVERYRKFFENICGV